VSARITLYCNTLWRYSTCATSLMTDAATVDEARSSATQLGWRSHRDGSDYCPGCSGTRTVRQTPVITLHPDRA